MTSKERFLSIKTYEEYAKQREFFKTVPFDEEMEAHLNKLIGPIDTTNFEVYRFVKPDGSRGW